MNYKMYDMLSYKLHCVQIDKFRKTKVIINFKRKVKKDEITLRSLLSKVLLESSKNYPTSRLMTIETENLYNSILNSSSFLSGNYAVISFESLFLNDEWVDDNLFEKAISFLLDIIMNPHVENNAFFENSFNLAKLSLEQELKSIKDNPNRYGILRLYEEMDSKSVSSYNAVGYLEDLENITSKDLYEYYKTFLKNDLIDIFIISPKEGEEIKNIFRDQIEINVLKKKSDSHFVSYNKYRTRNKIVHEKSDFQQSKIYIGCKFDKLSDFEAKYVSVLYSYILGGGPASRLFSVVREENSLCYYISSSFRLIYKHLIITAGINAKDFKKCLRLVKKELKNMQMGKFDDKKIEEAKITYLNSIKELKDSPVSILNTYIGHEYLGTDLIDIREKEINKVTKDMIVDFAKKLHVDTVYVLEGSDEDE